MRIFPKDCLKKYLIEANLARLIEVDLLFSSYYGSLFAGASFKAAYLRWILSLNLMVATNYLAKIEEPS